MTLSPEKGEAVRQLPKPLAVCRRPTRHASRRAPLPERLGCISVPARKSFFFAAAWHWMHISEAYLPSGREGV